jgi:alpha-glucosidase (family GH31 glycosyl hydrolase)
MHYSFDEKVFNLTEQYLFGTEFLIAPCMQERVENVNVYFPLHSGPWKHLVFFFF